MISCLGRDVGLRSARSWPVLGVVSASGVLQVLVCTVCPLLDQDGRLFSKHVGEVETCWFIIRYWRYTSDSLEIPFSVKIDFSAALHRRTGVNRGSEGTQDTLASSPSKGLRFLVFTVPCFVNCMIS